jgi:hypothetical protein
MIRSSPGQSGWVQFDVPAGVVANRRAGTGAELKRLIHHLGMAGANGCKCESHADVMDLNGADWCEENIETIVGWLREEAARLALPFIAPAARMLVRRAIAASRKAKNE